MAKSVSIVVTGDKQIDAALKRLETKIMKKTVRSALRRAGKKAHNDYVALVPVLSGSMRDATKVRTMRPTKKQRGFIGIRLVILRDKLFALYEARTGREPGKRREDDEPFFYPTMVEFGDEDTPAAKPLRESVFGNQKEIQSYFLSELRSDLKIT